MRLYITASTDSKEVCIDSIEFETKEGIIIVVDWDTSDIERTDSGFDARYKDVYYDDVYANGRLEEIKGAKVSLINSDEDVDIEIESMRFEDGNEEYNVPNNLL